MNKNIIVINGTGGSGKDTFVEYVSKYAKVYNFSSVDKVKEIAKLIGWTGTKTDKFLSDLKKLTTNYNDMSFVSIKEAINKFNSSNDEIMFIHIREPEEIQRVVDNFSAKTLLIKREGLKIIDTNSSDANVENYKYDYKIINTTLENLDKSALEFVQDLK